MLSGVRVVSLTRRLATHHGRPPAFADKARAAAAVAAAVAAAASVASVPSIAEGDEFARWAADLRAGRLADKEVDLVAQGPHEVGRLALAAHRLREAAVGERQFIWQTCCDGERRMKVRSGGCNPVRCWLQPCAVEAAPHQSGGGLELARAERGGGADHRCRRRQR